MEYLYWMDLAGTFVFAISGALAAAEKQFDAFGVAILAWVTAVGGGTLRDLLIGSAPVGWMLDNNYLLVIGLSLPVSYFFRTYILRLRRTFFLFDTIGIGLFTVMGLQKTLNVGLSPATALLMGMMSAVFGGVIRDVLANDVPLIFRREIYATACLAGGMVFLGMESILPNQLINIFCAVITTMAIRTLAVMYKWHLPFSTKM